VEPTQPQERAQPQEPASLARTYVRVRAMTDAIAAPLSPEDAQVQSMPDASPAKWHLAHTAWFFEAFVLQPFLTGYRVFHSDYGYLFNSYYEALGRRHARPLRGVLSRPSLGEVRAYRRHVDEHLLELCKALVPEAASRIELGPYGSWTEPERLAFQVDRTYRELRGVPWDQPVDTAKVFGEMAALRERYSTTPS